MSPELKLEKFTFKGVPTERPLLMAGPCSAESEEQVMETARQLKKIRYPYFQGRNLEAPHKTKRLRRCRKRGIAMA